MTERLISEIQGMLFGKIPNDQIRTVVDIVSLCMANYNITEKVKSLVVYDNSDEAVIKRFFVAKAVDGLCPSSLNYYRTILRAFFLKMGKHIDEIVTDDIRAYLAYKKLDKCSDNTLNNIRRVLSSFWGWCAAENICGNNPMSRIKGIRPTKKIRNPLTEDELELLRSSARSKRDKAIIEFLYSTGCRVSEMLNLNRDDVDLNNGQAIVLGKGRKYRTVYLSARCKAVLREYLDSRDDNLEPLFLSNYEGCMNKGLKNRDLHRMSRGAVEVMIRKLGRRVGLENVHPHRFRRTAATVALRRGMPLEQVQKFLGHENIQTTTIYAQSSNDEVKQSHERFMR